MNCALLLLRGLQPQPKPFPCAVITCSIPEDMLSEIWKGLFGQRPISSKGVRGRSISAGPPLRFFASRSESEAFALPSL